MSRTDMNEITLSLEQKQKLAQLAEQSGKSWSEVLDEAISRASFSPSLESTTEDIETWLARFDRWMSRQKPRNPNVDDSRESNYADRC